MRSPLPAYTVIPLTNNVPFNFTAGPGAALTNFFSFTVTNTPAQMHFALYQSDRQRRPDCPDQRPAAGAALVPEQPGAGRGARIHLPAHQQRPDESERGLVSRRAQHETNLIHFTILAVIDTNN